MANFAVAVTYRDIGASATLPQGQNTLLRLTDKAASQTMENLYNRIIGARIRAFVRRFLIVPVGVRLGRKVDPVDMADNENRAAYVAVSNTVIGIVMLSGGLIGLIGDKLGAAAIVLLLGRLSLLCISAVCRKSAIRNNVIVPALRDLVAEGEGGYLAM